MSDDFAWLAEHSLEIDEQYAGKCIAISNGEVVGVGDTVVEAAGQADRRDASGTYLLYAVGPHLDFPSVFDVWPITERRHSERA